MKVRDPQSKTGLPLMTLSSVPCSWRWGASGITWREYKQSRWLKEIVYKICSNSWVPIELWKPGLGFWIQRTGWSVSLTPAGALFSTCHDLHLYILRLCTPRYPSFRGQHGQHLLQDVAPTSKASRGACIPASSPASPLLTLQWTLFLLQFDPIPVF